MNQSHEAWKEQEAKWAAARAKRTEENRALHVPYPEFCSHPQKCAGKSYCQKEFCCAD